MALTKAEDEDLRRLAAFDRIGFLEDHGKARFVALRARDRRLEIRPVDDVVERLAPLKRRAHEIRGPRCSVYPV